MARSHRELQGPSGHPSRLSSQDKRAGEFICQYLSQATMVTGSPLRACKALSPPGSRHTWQRESRPRIVRRRCWLSEPDLGLCTCACGQSSRSPAKVHPEFLQPPSSTLCQVLGGDKGTISAFMALTVESRRQTLSWTKPMTMSYNCLQHCG